MSPRVRRAFVASTFAALLITATPPTDAAPALRVQVEQNGGFLLIGNTFGYECGPGTPAPIVGTLVTGACTVQGASVTDSAPDLFWRADAPAAGQATADVVTVGTQARSTAMLAIPSGATVTHAFLYWAAASAVVDDAVTLDRLGPGGFAESVVAIQRFTASSPAYQAVADITAIVRANGSGAYRVTGVDLPAFANVNNNNLFGGWSMVVLYASPTSPQQNLAVFDGLDVVSGGANQTATLSGFVVPSGGFSGSLGVIAYEGDNVINGDQLFFNGGASLANAQNPADNFFNGTRSTLGAAVSIAGDLPQLAGTAQAMAGLDLDIVDVTAKLSPGQTSALIQATTTGDVYYLGAFVTAVSSFSPSFAASKSVVDLDGGAALPGDVLRYTLTFTNDGNDSSVNTVVNDILPSGVSFVPGSLAITAGPNAGAMTDLPGDDQAEYDVFARAVRFRVGTGANGSQGGALTIGTTTTMSFSVVVDPGFTGTLVNQATITGGGQSGAPARSASTDSDPSTPGDQPATIVIDACASDVDCASPTPFCLTTASPRVCVACTDNAMCSGTTPRCDPAAHACRPCNADGAPSCSDPARPACLPSGACCECSATDATACSGARPVCVVATATCGCNGDLDCGDATSGMLCEGGMCQSGCSSAPGRNNCPATQGCTDTSGAIGMCIAQCAGDGDCTTAPLIHCDSAHTPSFCVECTADSQCGTGRVCSSTTLRCVECTATQLTECSAAGHGAVCLPTNTCGCESDSDCGDATSGRICDASTQRCVAGCRGTGGNGCGAGLVCSSADASAGTCANIVVDAGADAGVDATADVTVDAMLDANVDSSANDGASDVPSSDVRTDGGDSGDGGAGSMRAGCGCAVPGGEGHGSREGVAWVLGAVTAVLARRRRKHA